MSRSLLVSCSAAYTAGSVVGVAALWIERLAKGVPVLAESAAAYSLLGGLLAAAARGALGLCLPSVDARTVTLLVVGGFGAQGLLYWLNVRLLPGEHYLSTKSLAADVLAGGTVLALAFVAARSAKVRRARERWGREIAVLGVVLLAGASVILASRWPVSPPDPARQGTGPNLLLVVLDSARRDHLGLYGYGRPTSPSIDALGREARIYDAAYAASAWTVPSVLAILGSRLTPGEEGPTSLPQQLAARGYLTACFTDNPHMGRDSQLMEGFDRVERSVGSWRRMLHRTVMGELVERLDPGDDRRLVDKAIAWAERVRGPFFLYAQLMNSHTPYTSPPIDGKRRRGRRIEFPTPALNMTPEEAEDVVARYDGGIRSADAQAGRLLAAARSWGRPFVAVVTADHGESLGDGGRWFHGQGLAPELLAIPLLVLGEAVAPGRVAGPVGHDAVAPTLLAAAGVASFAGTPHDLRTSGGTPVVEGGLPPDLAYRIAGGFKVVVDRRNGRTQLFDLGADPRERRDVAAALPKLKEALANGVKPGSDPAAPPPGLEERLRALGYAH